MDTILEGLLAHIEGCLVYLDDIVVHRRMWGSAWIGCCKCWRG